MPDVGICSNVDLRPMEIHAKGATLGFAEVASMRASLGSEPEFWDGAAAFLVFLEPSFVMPAGRLVRTSDEAIQEWFDARLQELSNIAVSHPGTSFVVANVAIPNDTLDADVLLDNGTDGELPNRLNRAVHELASRLPNVIVLDWARIVALHGLEHLMDQKFWYVGRMPLTSLALRLIWEEFVGARHLLTEAPKKVLCVDLDNTLWRGICGEEGPRGVGLSEESIDKAFRDFQRQVKCLADAGVLLAVNSKNNATDAIAVMRENPMMILREEDFAALRINWSDKVENIRSIAQELMLGLDSFVFIDDSHVERELMRRALPEVAVPEFPADVHQLPGWFRSQVARKYFRRRTVTAEDRDRTAQYRRQQARKAEVAAVPREQRLAQLEIELVVERDEPANLPRLLQMSQKTNQFNLTTIRYTEAELAARMQSRQYSVWNAWYRDRFGDEGIVAMAVVAHDEPRLESLLMSCRVIGRDVEYAFMGELCRHLQSAGMRTLDASFRPTVKNAPCSDFLPSAGFVGGATEYRGDLAIVIDRSKARSAAMKSISFRGPLGTVPETACG